MPAERIADIRQDYLKAALDEASAGSDPLFFFKQWFGEAQTAGITEVNAMTLATVDEDGKPHARIVLLKGLDDTGFTFYTNYDSAKGKDLAQLPNAALVFFWKELERQVRIEGYAEKLSAEESDAYFNTRPEGSKLGAWASPQSKVIESRQEIEENLLKYSEQYNGAAIPRPEHWGGYRIVPQLIEFWQGRGSRLHDRIVFERGDGNWKKCRLAP